MLDVGQGDAFLIASEGKSLLIDTGNHDRMLLDQLARCHIIHLDGVLITHADDDHCGSLDAIQQAVDVDTVIMAKGMQDIEDDSCKSLVLQAKGTARNVKEVEAGDSFDIGRFHVSVLWPECIRDDGGNADSIVARVEYDDDGDGRSDIQALFTGDAEEEQIQSLVSKGLLGNVDILKVGHHGSHKSMSIEQAELLDPEIALIGVGANNRYGHPTEEVLEQLDDLDCKVFRTDLDGGVRLELGQSTVKARKL